MPNIQFNGTTYPFANPVTAIEAIAAFDKSLAKKAIAAKINGQLFDVTTLIQDDSTLELITACDKEGVEVIRHSCAHLLAQAVKELFSDVQVTIGPVIEEGFYYDFSCPHTFTEEDLIRIEQKMRELAKRAQPVKRLLLSREEAIRLFQEKNEKYKVEIIASIPQAENLSFYEQGDFIDLCRGPHVPNTAHIKVFKLTKLAGAYWRGDANNEMLQRVYGTAWATEEELQVYLKRIEEAEKRDHRKIGKQLQLFHFQEESPGMVFWHPKGWTIYQVIEQYLRQILLQHGYQEVRTPQVLGRNLWEKTGHWQNFHDNMFALSVEEKDYAIKPMNCPCHVQIFNQGLKSYRDLPLRLAEFGSCHRREPSGALHGLLRVRGFVQDDAHIFCTEEQIQEEVGQFIKLLYQVYADFGFTDVLIRLATRPVKRVGSDALWDKAELALETALRQHNLSFEVAQGEGAFYGPKIEFSLKDSLGRIWQCGTMQVDFNMPDRLDSEYIAEDNSRKAPVMLHRAILGSLERFIGMLLEESAGILPLWLAPVQAVVMNITMQQQAFVEEVAAYLNQRGYRVVTDLRNEKIGFKIREHTLQRVPYLLVVGDKEVAAGTVSVRSLNGENLGNMTLSEFSDRLAVDITHRSRVT